MFIFNRPRINIPQLKKSYITSKIVNSKAVQDRGKERPRFNIYSRKELKSQFWRTQSTRSKPPNMDRVSRRRENNKASAVQQQHAEPPRNLAYLQYPARIASPTLQFTKSTPPKSGNLLAEATQTPRRDAELEESHQEDRSAKPQCYSLLQGSIGHGSAERSATLKSSEVQRRRPRHRARVRISLS